MADRPVLDSGVLIDYLRGAGPGAELIEVLRAAGEGIEIRDAMQAGICLHAELPLLTRNLSHFERVPGLRAVHPEDWPRP